MTTTHASVPEEYSELEAINQNAKAQRKVGYAAVLALFFTIAAAQLFLKVISLTLDPPDPDVPMATGLVTNYIWWLLICVTGAAATVAYGLRARRFCST